MKTVLAAAFLALLVAGHAGVCFAAEGDGEADHTTMGTTPDISPSPPAGETGVETEDLQGQQPDGAADPAGDMMENVIRHRPGACPEGPPCKVGD